MAITKKLMKFGNSYGLVIEKPVLELLGINADTLLEVTTPNGKMLVITPVQDITSGTEARAKFKEAVEKVNDQFSDALRKLAE